MYESLKHPLLSAGLFRRRMRRHGAFAFGVLLVSLLVGMAGYAGFEHLDWTDAFLNASMILGGMGPVDLPKTEGGKLFAGTYALFSGLVFLGAASIVIAPLAHRMLHRFHWEESAKARKGQ
jgi:hypothetical protein